MDITFNGHYLEVDITFEEDNEGRLVRPSSSPSLVSMSTEWREVGESGVRRHDAGLKELNRGTMLCRCTKK